MDCVSPVQIRNPKSDDRDDKIWVPCGKCPFCLQSRQSDWIFRIEKEARYSKSAHFVTLTYDDENVPVNENGELELCKDDLQKFFKRLRKIYEGVKIRFYAVGEYGSNTDRPHYHAIIFNMPIDCVHAVDRAWSKGFIKVGTVTGDSIAYCTKYLINPELKDYTGRVRPFSSMSLKPGIGDVYREKFQVHHKKNLVNYVARDGYRHKLPRYYRDRIFDDDERALLAYESDQSRKHNYEANYNKLTKLGYDANEEMEIRKRALAEKILQMSNKNRSL